MNKKVFTLSMAAILSCGILAGCNKKEAVTDEELLARLVLDSEYEAPGLGFELPTEVIDKNGESHAISWSEDSDYVEIVDDTIKDEDDKEVKIKKTRITHPNKGEKNVNYKITGSVKNGEKTLTKDFEGIIVAKLYHSFTKVKDIFENINLPKDDPKKLINTGDMIEFEGTVAKKIDSGIYLVDDDNNVIYKYGNDKNIKVGDRVLALGDISGYHSMIQFGKKTMLDRLSKGTAASLPYYKEDVVTPKEIIDLGVESGNLIHGKKMKVSGVLDIYETEYKGKKELKGRILDMDHSFKSLDFYYGETTQDQLKALQPVNGKLVTMETIFYASNEDYSDYVIIDNPEEIPAGTELTAAQKSSLELGKFVVPSVILADLKNTWTHNDKNYNITYSNGTVGDVEYIAADGKIVNRPLEGAITLPKFTATIVNAADENDKRTIVLDAKVNSLKYTDMIDIMNSNDTETVFNAKVNVIAKSKYKTFIAESNGIYFQLFGDGLDSTVGKYVSLSGKYSFYNGSKQFKPTAVLGELEGTVPTVDYAKAIAIDDEKINAVKESTKDMTEKNMLNSDAVKNLLKEYQYKLVKFNGTVQISGGTHPTKYVKGTNFSEAYAIDGITDLEIGTEVTFYGTVTGVSIDKEEGKMVGLSASGFKVEAVA